MEKRNIYKYYIGSAYNGDNIITIEVPKNAEVLSIRQQGDDICVWYAVNPKEIEVRNDRWFQIGTGHAYPKELAPIDKTHFVDTIVAFPYVWHMFVDTNIKIENNDEENTSKEAS